MKKFLLCMICFFIFPFYIKASDTEMVDAEATTLASHAKSAILIEATTATILYERNSHEKLAPASMTKMMSMLLISEAIENGVINWDDMVTVSERASSMGGSQILLETGEQMSVADLFKGVAVASGNDAVVALAEAVAGSVDEFVKMMNDKVSELGLSDTVFKNPHGLDEANHYSSAYDMAMIAKELVKHEEVLKYSSIYEDYLRKGTDREFWLVNTNKLVRFNPIVDGLKTGFTSGAGYCLTATSFKNNMRLISTVMGEDNTNNRTSDTTELLDYGYAQYNLNNIISTSTVIDKINISNADRVETELVPINDVNILTKKSDKLGEISYKLNLNEINLPINNGDKVGTLDIMNDNEKIASVDVTVTNSLKKANLLKLYLRFLNNIITGEIAVLK